MAEKKRLFPTGDKPEMMKHLFYARCSETTSWEQKVVVSIPEGVTDKQLEALGQVLVENEDGVKELGFFDRTDEQEDVDIGIHQGDHFDESENSLPCRLNENGQWEIGGIHWEEGDMAVAGDGPHQQRNPQQEEYTAIRLGFERLAPVKGVVELWVPTRLAEQVRVGTHLAETLEDVLLERECVSWDSEANLKRAIRSPELESVEIVDDHEPDPAYRGVLKPTGKWKIMRLSSDGC